MRQIIRDTCVQSLEFVKLPEKSNQVGHQQLVCTSSYLTVFALPTHPSFLYLQLAVIKGPVSAVNLCRTRILAMIKAFWASRASLQQAQPQVQPRMLPAALSSNFLLTPTSSCWLWPLWSWVPSSSLWQWPSRRR